MILAHGLFLDDLAWFVIPVGLSIVLLRWAERRARRRAEAEDSDPAAPSGD